MSVHPSARRLITEFIETQIPFNHLLGVRVDALEPGRATLRIPFRADLIGDPFRPALHGGVISMLIDTTGGAAVFTRLADPGDRASTVDLRVDYLRPGRQEDLLAEASVVRMGNRVAVVEVKAFHAGDDEPVAMGAAVYNIRRVQDR